SYWDRSSLTAFCRRWGVTLVRHFRGAEDGRVHFASDLSGVGGLGDARYRDTRTSIIKLCSRRDIPWPTCLTGSLPCPGTPERCPRWSRCCDLHLGVPTRLLGMGPVRGLRRAGLSDSRARSCRACTSAVFISAQAKVFASHWSRRRRLDRFAEGR